MLAKSCIILYTSQTADWVMDTQDLMICLWYVIVVSMVSASSEGISNLQHRIQKVIFERLRFCGMQKLTLDILTLARKLNLKWIIGFSMLLDIVTTRLIFLLKQLNNNKNKCWSAKAFYFSLLFSFEKFLFWDQNSGCTLLFLVFFLNFTF